ncbi:MULTISPECIES: hypothetical protein [Pseudomonas]|uniref:hypothetical protein n=1 Tax=Pseudomonas TaxID=286 RepID=UPI00257A787B|nr:MULTISPECIES: hypothetical protein [Pseudomonas]
MRFINNWITQLNQPMGASATSLPVPDAALARLTEGSYLLTLVNSASALDQTQWEVIEVTVGNGLVHATRGREGTVRKAWPVGTLIYCGVTAGTLNELYAQIIDLASRVYALETGNPNPDPDPEPNPDPDPNPQPLPDYALMDVQGRIFTDSQGDILVGDPPPPTTGPILIS